MRVVVVALVFAVASCGKAPGPAKPTAAEPVGADALWKLAPTSATIGGVISGKALVQLDAGLAALADFRVEVPGMQVVLGRARAWRAMALGSAATLADAGIALDRGLAFFGDGQRGPRVALLPVVDRDKFVATHGGTNDGEVDHIRGAVCKPVFDAYACALDAAELVLGGGDLGGTAGVDGVRGDAELVYELPAFPKDAPLKPTGPVRVAVTVGPGELVVRAHLPARVRRPLDALLDAKPAAIDVATASGFLILPADIVDGTAPLDRMDPMVVAFFEAIAGPLTVVVPAGIADADIALPMSSALAARALLAACDALSTPLVPMAATKDACALGPVAFFGTKGTVWLDGNTVRAARAKGPVARGKDGIPSSDVGRELAGYTLAFWGRGTLIGADLDVPPGGKASLAAMRYLDELGFGIKVDDQGIRALAVIRTIHANPAGVVGELEAAMAAGADAAKVAAIAAAHPEAPFAKDAAAGPTGMLVPMMGMGATFAVAIPALLESMKQGKGGEPELALARISQAAKAYRTANGVFPAGNTGRTPSTPSCKEKSQVHAAKNPKPWREQAIWVLLDFTMEDAFFCEYQYQGTMNKFTATAYCDLDCDGAETQLVLETVLDAQGEPISDVRMTGTD